ncbi:hypothetical protein J6590_094949 [Homalodisca vitripennis]|nr:hypothetical protein J6590_094949 [Homalodisca vitripennis]
MHLRLPGKELLAEMIVEGLIAADGPPALPELSPTLPAAADACEPPASPAQNRLMQHDTYADVIKATSPLVHVTRGSLNPFPAIWVENRCRLRA